MAFGNLGQEIKATPDKPFDAKLLGDGSVSPVTGTSGVFQLGKDQAATELMVTTPSGFTLAQDETLVFTLYHTVDPGTTTGDASVVIATLTGGTGGTAYAADAELLRYTPETNIGSYCLLTVVNDGTNLATATIDAFVHPISR